MHVRNASHSFEIAVSRGSLFIRIGRRECHIQLTPRAAKEPGWWCINEGNGAAEGRIGPVAWCACVG